MHARPVWSIRSAGRPRRPRSELPESRVQHERESRSARAEAGGLAADFRHVNVRRLGRRRHDERLAPRPASNARTRDLFRAFGRIVFARVVPVGPAIVRVVVRIVVCAPGRVVSVVVVDRLVVLVFVLVVRLELTSRELPQNEQRVADVDPFFAVAKARAGSAESPNVVSSSRRSDAGRVAIVRHRRGARPLTLVGRCHFRQKRKHEADAGRVAKEERRAAGGVPDCLPAAGALPRSESHFSRRA